MSAKSARTGRKSRVPARAAPPRPARPPRDLGRLLRVVPGFPKPGIMFQDITPLLADAAGLREAVRRLAAPFRGKKVDVIVAPEARGFILGAPVACELGAGFAPARKPGKLPWRTRAVEYALEYGTDKLCLHEDAVKPGARVLIVDDLLATGGTVAALARLVTELGGQVAGCAFLVELDFLKGREKLKPHEVVSLIHVAGE